MTEWRQEVAEGANPVTEWLDARVEVTGDRSDYILLATVDAWKTAFCVRENPAATGVLLKDFKKFARAHLVGQPGVRLESQAFIRGVHLNSCFRGVRAVQVVRDILDD